MSEKQKFSGLRTYYTLILTQTLSMIGSRISSLAIGIWVYQQTGDATPLGIVAALGILPTVLASNFAGVLADRYDRRYVMAFSDAGQAAGTLLLLASFTSGGFQLWHLYIISLIQAIFGVFQGPAFMAAVTMLVTDEQRDRANVIQQLQGPAAGIIAPALAGMIYALVGIGGTILIDMVTFLIAVVVVLMVHIPRPQQTEEGQAMKGSFLQESLSGIRYMWERKPLLWNVLLVTMLNFLLAGIGVLLTPYILSRTGSEATLGVLVSLVNLGALVGGAVFGWWGGTRPRIHTFMIGVILTGILVSGLGIAQTPVTIGLFMFLYIFPIPAVNASMLSIFQIKVAPDVQGRVFAVLGQLAMLMTPISYVMVGILADNVFEPAVTQPAWTNFAPIWGGGAGSGIGLMISISGGLAALVALIAYALPSIRRMEATLPDYAPVAAEPNIQTEVEVSGDLATA